MILNAGALTSRHGSRVDRLFRSHPTREKVQDMTTPNVDVPDVDIDALIRGDRSRRPLWLGATVLGVIVAAAAGFYFAQGEEVTVAVAPRQVEATQGQLTTTLNLSGTGNAATTVLPCLRTEVAALARGQ